MSGRTVVWVPARDREPDEYDPFEVVENHAETTVVQASCEVCGCSLGIMPRWLARNAQCGCGMWKKPKKEAK